MVEHHARQDCWKAPKEAQKSKSCQHCFVKHGRNGNRSTHVNWTGVKVLRAEIPGFGGLFAAINMLHWLICENKRGIVKKGEEENISLAKMHQSEKSSVNTIRTLNGREKKTLLMWGNILKPI